MNYKLLKAQREFLEVPHDYHLDVAVYQGGFGSGKTFAGSLLGILLCQKYPRVLGLVGAMTYPLVRDTTLASYFEHLDNFNLKEGKDYFFNKSEQKLTFKNGSEVLFKHLSEPYKLKSLNLGFAQIEEMSEIPHETFKMILSRMRQRKRKCWKNFQWRIFGHTNPESKKGWIYKTFVDERAPNYRLIKAPTTDNIYLPQGFCEELKKIYDEKYYNINVLGEWGDYDTGHVVKDFSDENLQEIKYNKDFELHITCDFNVDPMCWTIAHKTADKVFFFDEITLENTTTARACDEFFRRYPDHKGKIIINGDASGDNRSCTSEYTNYKIIQKKLSSFGYDEIAFDLRAFNPPIKNRIIAFNAMIKSMDGERRLFVDKKCKYLLYNIYNLKYRAGSGQIDVPTYQKIKTNSELKFLSHPFDAASYLVEYYWPLGM